MKDFAALFFLLMFMNTYDVDLSESEKLQMIRDFNAGNPVHVVQIRHDIGEALTITDDE